MDSAGIKTKRAFIDNAIALFEAAIKERRKGRRIGSVDKNDIDKCHEFLMPALVNIKPSKE